MNAIAPEDFQALLVRHLRDDGWFVEVLAPLEIRVQAPHEAGSGVVHLANLYREYQHGALIGAIADSVMRSLHEAAGALADVGPLDLERLMPLLKPRALLDEVARTGVDAIAWQPFITGDLIVTLVLDFPQSIRYLKAAEVAATGRSFDDLLDAALANLYRRSEGEVYQFGDKQTGRMFALATRDGYDATRILLSPLLERLAAHVSGALIIGIPNRDFLIAFGNTNPLAVGQIGQQVRSDARSRSHPLTATLFTFRDGRLHVYAEDESGGGTNAD